uniref:glutathione transferase n=1 Tax=Caenorhabditis japonica TaxID=281687 RepID=A0A8R1E1L5_CAEJA
MPFHTLPVLYVDNKPLAQSHAIARYLARQFGINGKTPWQEAQVNSLADQFKEYQHQVHPYFMAKNGIHPGDAQTLYKEVFLPNFEKNYQFFTNFLNESGSDYLVGDSLTWVDLLIAQNTTDIASNTLAKFPEMEEHRKRIHTIPRVKRWIEKGVI